MIRKAISKFYHVQTLRVDCQIQQSLKLLCNRALGVGILWLVYKFKRIVGKPYFSDKFKKIMKGYKKLDKTWISCDHGL